MNQKNQNGNPKALAALGEVLAQRGSMYRLLARL